MLSRFLASIARPQDLAYELVELTFTSLGSPI